MIISSVKVSLNKNSQRLADNSKSGTNGNGTNGNFIAWNQWQFEDEEPHVILPHSESIDSMPNQTETLTCPLTRLHAIHWTQPGVTMGGNIHTVEGMCMSHEQLVARRALTSLTSHRHASINETRCHMSTM